MTLARNAEPAEGAPARRAPLTIACSLPPAEAAMVERHPAVTCRSVPAAAPWEVAEDAEVLFTHQAQWGAAGGRPDGWPHGLRWLQTMSAGVELLPDWAFEVPLVTRGVGIQSQSIAEFVIGAVFAVEKGLLDAPMRGPEDWQRKALGSVAGKVLGIAGLGDIGLACARLGQRVGMSVVGLARAPREVPGIEMAGDMAELAARSDHLVLALPLTPATRGMVGAEVLAAARPGLHLVNVARGALLDEAALLAALDRGALRAATLDATWPEPPEAGSPLYAHPGIRLSPHVSGVTDRAEQAQAARMTENIDAYLAGEPVPGIVDPARGY
ncbi:NAD(P)-dependent oxidoreductase [Pseudoroseicyclus sp. H15]